MKRKRKNGNAAARKKCKRQSHDPCSQHSTVHHHSILSVYYQHIYTLREALLEWLPATSRARKKRFEQFDIELPQHAGFLDNVVVAFNAKPSIEIQNTRRDELVAFTQTQRAKNGNSLELHPCNVEEIVNFTVWTLFRRDGGFVKAPSHLLCLGLQRNTAEKDHDHANNLQLPGIVQRSRNPNLEALKNPPWTNILNSLGKDAQTIALTLFLDCGIFQYLESGKHNLYQVSGEAISQLQPRFENGLSDSKGAKLDRVTQTRPGSIMFIRNRMFHAKPTLNNRGKVQLGMKHIHILNRCHDLENFAQDTRVMQYVFPRQFGLHNVFTTKPSQNETTQALKDYTIREQELGVLIDKQVVKIPRRLRGVLDLIRKLRRNHQQCSYTQLLRHYCPFSPINGLSPSDLPEKELRSLSLFEPCDTQLHVEGATCLNESGFEETYTTSFMPYATPPSQVVAFCQAVMLQLLPRDSFGNGIEGFHNWNVLLKSIDQFINMRRFESITLHEVCQRLKLRCINWLRPPSIKPYYKLSMSDRAKRSELLQELTYYIYDSILIPLIRSNFYVTETGTHRNRLFYFHHEVWKKLSEPSLSMMRLRMFERLPPRQLKHGFTSSHLGCSHMRLLPKEHGARPIMNLKRRSVKIIHGRPVLGKSINSKLRPVFNVLNFERNRQPDMLASAIFSVNEIQDRLWQFKARLESAPQRTYYFVKVDIRSAFDTIPQQELLRVIQNTFLDQEYSIAKHAETKKISRTNNESSESNIHHRYVYRAIRTDEDVLLSSQTANELACTKRRYIFSGAAEERMVKLSEVKKLLTEHLQQNIVKIGRKHFRQVEGIPQGSILSSLLCNLFYADFEHQELGFLDLEQSLLLRLTDDFLLITIDQTQASKFIQGMCRGNIKHGISVNTDKSLVNFEVSVDGHKIPRTHTTGSFPYCGMMIDTYDLQIRKERDGKNICVEDGLTVTRSGRIGVAFQSKILASLKRQFYAMLLDGALNTRAQILRSVFECFVESTMKLHQHLKSLPRFKRPSQEYIIMLCDQLMDLAFKMYHRAQVHDRIDITRSQISWLAAAALIQVLRRKQSEYSKVLRWLGSVEIHARKSMNLPARDLEYTTRQGMSPFVGYKY